MATVKVKILPPEPPPRVVSLDLNTVETNALRAVLRKVSGSVEISLILEAIESGVYDRNGFNSRRAVPNCEGSIHFPARSEDENEEQG